MSSRPDRQLRSVADIRDVTGGTAVLGVPVTESCDRAGVPGNDLPRCRLLGFAGSALLSLGGFAVGALPVSDPFGSVPGLRELRSAPGVAMVCGYLGLTLLVGAWLWLGRAASPSASC